MTPLHAMLLLAMLMVVLMTAGWLWQREHRNAGIVDVFWAGGLGLAAVLMAMSGEGAALPRLLTGGMGALWAARLALHLWHRVKGEAEDGRYRYLREHWQGHQGKFFAFFQGQAAIVMLFALPFMAAAANPLASPFWMSLAVVIWVTSVVGESVADRQLARYRADARQRGKTFRGGLWRYSRHPNYFFEWLHWFAYVALAVGSPLAWLAWAGPLVMYIFLRWVSGIPFTEAQALRSRGDDYRDYQRTTPMLIPWFPSSSSPPGERHEHPRR
jgi:steroid 5-alpha reductase family enzyme